MDKDQTTAISDTSADVELDQVMGEELTDEQLLQMAEGSCSWGANCSSSGC